MRDDSVLKWLVDARNRIVKEADLSTKSVAKVGLVQSYLEPPQEEFTVDPLTPTLEIARAVLNAKPQCVEIRDGFVRVERRWVDQGLPEHEILDALAHVYGVLSALVADAHTRLGGGNVPDKSAGVQGGGALVPYSNAMTPPTCMGVDETFRIVCVKANTGQILTLRRQSFEADERKLRDAAIHYGWDPKKDVGARGTNEGLAGTARFLFEQAKRILEVDGFHLPFAFLMLPNAEMRVLGLNTTDWTDKYLVWRGIADEVKKTGATSIVVINESWLAKLDPANPAQTAAESPTRQEALTLHAASAAGEELSIVCFFRRVNGSIEFAQDEEATIDAYFLEPLRRAWSGVGSPKKGPSGGCMPKKERNIKKRKR
jgi:hypothetical protein